MKYFNKILRIRVWNGEEVEHIPDEKLFLCNYLESQRVLCLRTWLSAPLPQLSTKLFLFFQLSSSKPGFCLMDISRYCFHFSMSFRRAWLLVHICMACSHSLTVAQCLTSSWESEKCQCTLKRNYICLELPLRCKQTGLDNVNFSMITFHYFSINLIDCDLFSP